MASRRLVASSPWRTLNEVSPPLSTLQCFHPRPFSVTSGCREDDIKKNPMAALGKMFESNQEKRDRASRPYMSPFLDIEKISSTGSLAYSPIEERYEEPHHFHVYATKHNTHITLTKPNRDPLISVSAGNIGFKKSGRKHYDSAFQLAGYVMGRIQEQGLLPKIKQLELCLRGFGAGREAVTKAMLGNEGRYLRSKVVKVSDATRLKFGGTRSPKPRRLG